MSDSNELRTIKKCAVQLETALKGLDSKLVHFLNEEGFINDDVRDAPASLLSEANKANELVKWIRNRVELSKGSYHILLDWFKRNGKLYEPIVDTLCEEYEKGTHFEHSKQQHEDAVCEARMEEVSSHTPEENPPHSEEYKPRKKYSIIETSETERFCQPSRVHDVFQVYYIAEKEKTDYHGKWMVFKHYDQIDDMWRLIRTAIAEDKLQGCLRAKCSTMKYDPTKEGPGPSTTSVIRVYTEEHNIDVIGFKLIEIVKHDIKYKTNIATRSGNFSFTGPAKPSSKTIFWNRGRPSFVCTGRLCFGTSFKTEDIWYLNVVEAPEPFISREVHGRWILYLEYKELTELWHLLKDLVESKEKNFGVIKMVCPTKRDRKSAEEKPEFLVYTSREDHTLVGRKLIEHVKRDIDYEFKPPENHDTGTKESLLWNGGKPGYN